MTNMLRMLLVVSALGFCAAALAIEIDTVPIKYVNNPPTENGAGSVPYEYRIGTHEVTNSQYVEFLNSVAVSDPNGLFHPIMASDTRGGIIRTGSPGSFTYAVKPPVIGQGFGGADYMYENKPVVFVSYYDAVRFINWLHNGQANGDTESGAYTLLGPSVPQSNISVNDETLVPANFQTITRDENARWFLPNANEWYKAACYDPITQSYFDYPTGTDAEPNNNIPSDDTGNSANLVVGSYATNSEKYTTGNESYPLTDVGSYLMSSSPYGTFDQLGNVAEWVERLTPHGFNDVSGGLLGAAWNESIYYNGIPYTCCWFADDSAWFKLSHVGFRVAATVPEPSGLLLYLTALSMAVCRHRRVS